MYCAFRCGAGKTLKRNMKKTTFILAAALALSILPGCGSETTAERTTSASNPAAKAPTVSEDDPEVFGRKVAELVIAGDYTAIDQLIISPDAMKAAISSSNVSPGGKETAINRADAEVMKMHSEIRQGVDTVRARAMRNGIAWENASVKQVIPQVDKSRGFAMLRLKCVVVCNGVESYFTVTDIVGTDKGWKLAGYFFYGDAPRGK
jgi:hypothetical protein